MINLVNGEEYGKEIADLIIDKLNELKLEYELPF